MDVLRHDTEIRSRKFFVVTQCGHSIVRRKSNASGRSIHVLFRTGNDSIGDTFLLQS